MKEKIKQPPHFNQDSRRENKKEMYKILCIDGGGVRGIQPAFWLNEIERKSRKPISHLFDMIAGTSTGAIIAAGLSVPEKSNPTTPIYKAYDILKLYQTKGKQIFGNPKNGLLNARYSDEGRLSIFGEYFNSMKLDQSITDLVIPAVNEKHLNQTHLFNTFQAKTDPFFNQTYADALMATTAAPTFFMQYKIDNIGVFVDGGVHANNPAELAYNTALKNGIRKENICLVSLGTGDYVPDPKYPNSGRGLIFWASNLKDFAFSKQL